MVMEDWDLQAVVRGFNNNNNIEGYSSYTIHSPQHNDCFEPFSFSIQENNFQAFHDDLPNSFFQSTAVLTELEQLIYRPFCPTVHSLISSPTMLTSCMSAPKQVHQQDDINQLNNAKASPPKSFKKRRNQQKREVKHVTEDGLSSDMWAWRKYGQKPIKGSPYPRSYYRCSSSKGCSARKQVERSPSNPEMFVVTYTAEHTHAHPTRRSSLAGSTRTKFPQSKTKSFDSTKHVNSPLPISNFDRDHDQHVQTTSIIKMEEVDQISINETDLLTDHRMLSHDQLLPNSLEDHKKGLDEEMNEQTSDLALHNGGFMDDQYFLDDFLSSWLS